MSYSVTVKTIPERYAATVRMIIPRYEDEQKAWNVLHSECDSMLVPAEPCLAGADFFDEEYKEENVDVRIWMTVNGSYSQLTDATATAMAWMRDNGYTMNGAMFCIYHVSPAQTSNPDELVTEICFPVE